jgi:hypothetical protein
MKKIIFIPTIDLVETLGFNPIPAKKEIPEWYKKIKSYIGEEKKISTDTNKQLGTIKKCMPVFDAMTSGYIIRTYADISIQKHKEGTHFAWSLGEGINWHSYQQIENYPSNFLNNGEPVPKFMNPWGIKTPKGYSVLICNPMHNKSSIFSILEGIVDTDKYDAPVNFPFIIIDKDFEGIIPAGTPIAQVIPFKRDRWTYSVSKKNKDKKNTFKTIFKLQTLFYDSYKTNFRDKKYFD